MDRFCLFIAVLLAAGGSQSKFIRENQPPVAGYRLKYDHRALKIPGQKFAICLVAPKENKPADTIGFPGNNGGWGKYHIEVDSGSYSGGRVKLRDSKVYKKGDSVTVNVYARKWFLGGRGKFLTTRKIPYNFEDSIALMTDGNSNRFPGGHVKFGVRTLYNDKQFADLWYPVKKKNKNDFQLGFDGGHLSKKKGDWKIDTDPTKIHNDKVELYAALAKAPAIRDTIGWMLDYKAAFQCNILSMGDGHDLDVSVDALDDTIIEAKLLWIEVLDNATHRTYHYVINTQGGSINITSTGANGAGGEIGQSGADGAISQMPVTSVDTAGKTITTYVTVQGPGGDGGDGGDGADGGTGYNGGNGGNITFFYTPSAAPFLTLITASSFPGAGGPGGNGGAGGRGGNGGNGNPQGRAGRSGRTGNIGMSGQDGNPGAVRFVAQ